ncbi:MAG: hypothetical protein JST01_26125 [Cyanobacteria bacterium SZAS TMP-1]|nr:hypothetical protein [Cyanobacteria bacterium SZAS TMP-1]
MDEKDIVNPIDPKAGDDEKVRQLSALSDVNEPLIVSLLAEIDAECGTVSKPNRKEPAKIKEKANRPSIKETKPWHDIEHIRDSLRFKSVLSDLEALPKIAHKLKASGIRVVKIDTKKLLNPGIWGWRIVVFDLRMPNGQLVEYYCPVDEMEKAKNDKNHDLFEKWRAQDYNSLSEKQKKQRIKDLNESFDRYQMAWDAFLKRNGQSTERVQEILKETHEILAG